MVDELPPRALCRRYALTAGVLPFWIDDAIQEMQIGYWRGTRSLRRLALLAQRRFGATYRHSQRRRVDADMLPLMEAAAHPAVDAFDIIDQCIDADAALKMIGAKRRRWINLSVNGKLDDDDRGRRLARHAQRVLRERRDLAAQLAS